MNRLQEDKRTTDEALEAIEDTPQEESDLYGEFPRSTTGVIKIMRSKGRSEMADLVEDLYSANKQVTETTKRAENLLRLLRSLHKKATGTEHPITLTTKTCTEDA